MTAVEQGMSQFVRECAASSAAIHCTENGLRELGKVRLVLWTRVNIFALGGRVIACNMQVAPLACVPATAQPLLSMPPPRLLAPAGAQPQQQHHHQPHASAAQHQTTLERIGAVAPFGSWVSGLHTLGGDLDLSLDGWLEWCGQPKPSCASARLLGHPPTAGQFTWASSGPAPCGAR